MLWGPQYSPETGLTSVRSLSGSFWTPLRIPPTSSKLCELHRAENHLRSLARPLEVRPEIAPSPPSSHFASCPLGTFSGPQAGVLEAASLYWVV